MNMKHLAPCQPSVIIGHYYHGNESQDDSASRDFTDPPNQASCDFWKCLLVFASL